MRLAGFDIPPVALLALAVVTVALLLGLTRWKLRRSRSVSSSSPGETSLTRDIEAVMVELDRLSRQVHGRLDGKIAKLEGLIREADRRIDDLSRLSRSATGHPTIDVTLGPESTHSADSDNPEGPAAPDRKRVYALADSGMSSIEIARELGESTGEIELILALRKAKVRTQRAAV